MILVICQRWDFILKVIGSAIEHLLGASSTYIWFAPAVSRLGRCIMQLYLRNFNYDVIFIFKC